MAKKQEVLKISKWNLKLWLWAVLCAAGILLTVPVARGLQKFVYAAVGKEFFTYVVLFIVIAALIILLYIFIFRLRIRNVSQYVWLILCGSLYVYFTINLKKHPEEALHFLEYGLLTFFVFRALSYRIHDWTVYISTIVIVSTVGTLDEFIQWLLPSRVWDYGDIRLNILGGIFFILAVWKGVRPATISERVNKFSIKVLATVLTVQVVFLGLCLANTPQNVNRYTSVFESLSWLRGEEVMTEYGEKTNDLKKNTISSGSVEKNYSSKTGKVITAFSMKTALISIAAFLSAIWIFYLSYSRKGSQ